MTIEFKDCNGKYIKQWPNWNGVVPMVNDHVLLHFGDKNEESVEYYVIERGFSGTDPDKVFLMIKELSA